MPAPPPNPFTIKTMNEEVEDDYWAEVSRDLSRIEGLLELEDNNCLDTAGGFKLASEIRWELEAIRSRIWAHRKTLGNSPEPL